MSSATPTIWTIGALLEWTEQFFRSHNIDSPRLDAQVLLAHALQCKRTDLYVRYGLEPTESQRAAFRAMVQSRAAGQPVAYIVGSKEFFLLTFEVTPAVLIPRPATETLVMHALNAIAPLPAPTVLDIGTGSGCIAISMAVNSPNARITATDTSRAAIEVARRNAIRHKVESRVTLVESVIFSSLGEQRFDLIVSNPPYIPSDDIAKLSKDVAEFEPRSALDGGPDGFAVIDRIIGGAGGYLAKNGVLMVEVGIGQADAVANKFTASKFNDVRIEKDADGIARVVIGRYRS